MQRCLKNSAGHFGPFCLNWAVPIPFWPGWWNDATDCKPLETMVRCAASALAGGPSSLFIPSSVIHRCKTRWREAVPAICLPGAGHLLTMVALRQFHYSLSPRMDGTCALNISYAFCIILQETSLGRTPWLGCFWADASLHLSPLCHNGTCSLGVDLSSSANDCVLPSTLTSASCRSSIEICSGFLKAGGISPHKVSISKEF